MLLTLAASLHRCSAGQFLFMGGCYNISATGSGVCREARDGVCVMYEEEMTDRKKEPMRVREGSTGCTANGTDTDHYANSKCDVTINGKTYCSQCATGYVPIDGTCTDISGDTSKCTTNSQGACTQCGDGYFLHKGGCYQIGGAAGLLICTDTIPSDPADTAGKCATCAPGYFKNPTQAADKLPCIACNDETGDNTNKGKLGCATCNPPNPSGAATCLTYLDGYYNSGSESSLTCTACNAACATCTGSGDTKCTSCKETDKYLKTDSSAGTSQCVTEAACKQGGTHFPATDANQKKTCTLCSDAANGGVADCQTCTPKPTAGLAEAPSVTCSACTTPTKKPNADGTKCVDCAAVGCVKCSDEGVCVECDSSHYLTPTGQCVDSCDKLGGYYADSNVCKPCSPECTSCSTAGADKCLSCPAGKVLKYTSESDISGGGSCVDECKANTGGCADCGAVIGGSKYCSKCSDASQAPLNGNCAANTARTKFCTNASNGACTQCANGYFLLDGGCYQTSRQPGSQVCTQADATGKCKTCTNGQTPDSSGVCPACPAGCSKCTASSNSQTCSECLAGYYKTSANTCVKCDKDDSNIKGVPNCVSCAPPSSNTGPVTCYVTQTPAVDPTDPSVNKGGLSRGATRGHIDSSHRRCWWSGWVPLLVVRLPREGVTWVVNACSVSVNGVHCIYGTLSGCLAMLHGTHSVVLRDVLVSRG